MSVAGIDLEQLAGEMPGAAVAARAEGELAGIRLGIGDEFLRGVDRQRRVDDEHVRRDRDQRDRREVLDRVVRHLRVEAGVDRVRRQRSHQDRVAVGRRFRNEIGADVAARAGAVVHHNALAPRVAQLLRDRAADDVERSARRKRHDEPHRPVRVRGGRLRGGVHHRRRRAVPPRTRWRAASGCERSWSAHRGIVEDRPAGRPIGGVGASGAPSNSNSPKTNRPH